MITLILSNGSIIETNEIDENQRDVVGYLYNSSNIKKINDKKFNNIHKDIVIKNGSVLIKC